MVRKFDFQTTEIPGLIKITPFLADDDRGCLVKAYSDEIFKENGCRYDMAEELILKSYPGVIRGLHFQRVKQPVKLVQCVSGHVCDVVVDLKRKSPTFKKWLWFDLDARENTELLIPGWCATGYLTLEASTIICKCSERFYPEYDSGIRWDDSELNIKWPLELIGGLENVVLSERDQKLQSFREFIEAYGGL